MRQIRFRAKPCCMGGNQPAWVYGTFQYIAQRRVRPGATDNGTLEPRNDKGRIVDLYGTETEVLCDTVGQFTGMTDKNGKNIFEGDILLWTRKDVHIEGRPIQDFSDKCIIYYDNDKCGFRYRCKLDCGFCVGNLDFSDDRAKESYIEVIGNIYDDPKLLKRH